MPDPEEKSEFEEFYEQHWDKFPEDFQVTMDSFLEIKKLFYETEPYIIETLQQPLTRLMLEQYPAFNTVTDPEQKRQMAEINELLGHDLAWGMYGLLRDVKKGINWKEEYPKIERWRLFYCHPQEPDLTTDEDRNPMFVHLYKSDEEWEQYKKEENEAMLQFHNWKESRQQAFYDIVQPFLFQTFPGLPDIEGDAWVIYAMTVRDAYEQWLSFSERLELVIDYKMPVESYYFESNEFHQAMKEADPEDARLHTEGRNSRIDSHK